MAWRLIPSISSIAIILTLTLSYSCALIQEHPQTSPAQSSAAIFRRDIDPAATACYYRYQEPEAPDPSIKRLVAPRAFYDVQYRVRDKGENVKHCNMVTVNLILRFCMAKNRLLTDIPDLPPAFTFPYVRYPVVSLDVQHKLCKFSFRMFEAVPTGNGKVRSYGSPRYAFSCIAEALACEYGDGVPQDCVRIMLSQRPSFGYNGECTRLTCLKKKVERIPM